MGTVCGLWHVHATQEPPSFLHNNRLGSTASALTGPDVATAAASVSGMLHSIRVIAAKDLDSTPKTVPTCRLPAASEDSTTHSGLVRPKRGCDGVRGGVGHGVRRQPTKPNNTAGPRFRGQWQAASFMHHRRADHP